jgi:hypothetical protein
VYAACGCSKSERLDLFVSMTVQCCTVFILPCLYNSQSNTCWFAFQVHWFPRHISELDLIANRTLDAGTDLQSDHPGFNDVEYRNRRALLAEQAMKYRMGMELPSTEYSDDEVETWGVVWDKMEGLLEKVRCNTCVQRMLF